jgi:hypothetical protein
MRNKSLFAAAACAAALAGISAGPAFAGEITGNGKPVLAPAKSGNECAFSGHNDAPDNPLDIFNAGGPSQSYGQLNRLGLIKSLFGATPSQFNPSDACNPHAAE